MTDAERLAFERSLSATQEITSKLMRVYEIYRTCRPEDKALIEAQIDKLWVEQDRVFDRRNPKPTPVAGPRRARRQA
jgi:hypothetical protein